MLTYQCHNMWIKIWIDSNILNQKAPNMPHISGQSLHTEKRIQMALDLDHSNLLDKKYTKRIQYIVVKMLYYAWSIDPEMLQPINEILRVQ